MWAETTLGDTMSKFSIRSILSVSAATCALTFAATTPAFAADAAAAATTAADAIVNRDDIVVTATKVNQAAPITSSVHTTEPQSIISRSIIESSVPPTADFSDVILLTPGASGTSNGNGPGLSESKTILRGFSDGQFNITWDGIPFGDSNDPTHHSTAYFPDGTYERIIVDRGPGHATDLGQASYGGNVHLISRDPSDKFGVEGLGDYGSYNSYLGRLTVNSGRSEKLGGLKAIGVVEYKKTDGALTNSNAWFYNLYGKLEKPLGSHAKFSLSAAYNQDFYHQSDNNGVSCTGSIVGVNNTSGNNCVNGSQVATYGKKFGLVNVNDPTFANTPWPGARSDWNWTRKSTDFEVARLTWDVTHNITFDNKAYTYFYKNFTLSSQTSTQPCAAVGGVLVQTSTQCSGYADKVKSTIGGQTILGTVPTAGGATVYGTDTFVSAGDPAGPVLQNNPNDISGYTKLNQYRTSGDIAQVDFNTPIGLGKLGFWYEHSVSHRYGYTVDLTLAAANNTLGDGYYNFSTTVPYYDYGQFVYNANLKQLDGSVEPQYLRYDERTGWDQYQVYGEFNFKLLNDTLTITPGFKAQNFTRTINTPLASQSARVGITTQASYKPTLPYATINYLIQPNFSVYAQFAKGFLVPSLGNSLENVTNANATGTITGGILQPTRTTNYQAGLVYAGERINIDADVYYINATNSTFVDPSTGIATQSGNPVTYEGVEGQVSYVVGHGLTAIANASLASSKDDGTHLWITQAPNYTALLGAVYSHGPVNVSYLQKFTGRQWADTGNTVHIAPYSVGTFTASYTFRQFSLGVAVYDVFDDTSTTKIGGSTGSRPLYFFNPGRSYQGVVKVKF
jgi:iron complex outermembrane receptor protein